MQNTNTTTEVTFVKIALGIISLVLIVESCSTMTIMKTATKEMGSAVNVLQIINIPQPQGKILAAVFLCPF